MPSDPHVSVRMVAARRRDDTSTGYLARQLGDALVRHRAGKSQRSAAADLGVAGNTLRELEEGRANPTLARIEDLAGKLGLVIELRVRRARR